MFPPPPPPAKTTFVSALPPLKPISYPPFPSSTPRADPHRSGCTVRQFRTSQCVADAREQLVTAETNTAAMVAVAVAVVWAQGCSVAASGTPGRYFVVVVVVLVTPSLRTLLSLPRGPMAGAKGGSPHLGKGTPRPHKTQTGTRQDKNKTRTQHEEDLNWTTTQRFAYFFASLTINKKQSAEHLEAPDGGNGWGDVAAAKRATT